MLEVGWSEMLVIAVILIVVVGPKDLPGMLRSFGRTTAKLRTMAGDFQRQFNEALKEAELDDVKKSVDELRSLNPKEQIRKHINPFEKAAADVRAGLDSLKPQSPKPAEPVTNATETGSTVKPDTPASGAPVATASATTAAAVGKPAAKAKVPAKASAPSKSAAPKSSAKPKTAPRKTTKSAKA